MARGPAIAHASALLESGDRVVGGHGGVVAVAARRRQSIELPARQLVVMADRHHCRSCSNHWLPRRRRRSVRRVDRDRRRLIAEQHLAVRQQQETSGEARALVIAWWAYRAQRIGRRVVFEKERRAGE